MPNTRLMTFIQAGVKTDLSRLAPNILNTSIEKKVTRMN